jgi:hypothetical protein
LLDLAEAQNMEEAMAAIPREWQLPSLFSIDLIDTPTVED